MRIFPVLFIMIAINCSTSIFNDDESKSQSDNNNSISTANIAELGKIYKFSINYKNDTDYYKINIPNGGLLKISCSDVPLNIDLYMELQDIESQKIVDIFGSKGNPVDFYYNAKPGIYYLMIKDGYNSDYSSQEMNLSIQIDSNDIYEYNNDTLHAAPIDFNVNHKISILPLKDEDYFSIEINTPQYVKFKIDSVSSKINIYLEILNFEGVKEYEHLENLGKSVNECFGLLKGKHFILIKDGYNDNCSVLPFTMTLSKYEIDTCEWNNDTTHAKPIALNSTVAGYIYPLNDTDFYSFNIPDSQNVTIKIDSISSKINMYFELYNKEFKNIDSYLAPTGKAIDRVVKLPAGKYYLMLKDGFNDATSEQKYELKVL